MESVGKFEFSRKDLIGHGAFAVVFKGRHKEKRDWQVAVKCISKKNLAKSQALLGKEIKILKELKHENIVRLLDYQEIGGCVYLVMEYCNGGDLAEYLHTKGTLSEDTIRIFLQQIAQAMEVLRIKGILHRDLKPQNILLCHPVGRRSSPINTCIKIADFGFARHLQTNTMAATMCGSPMYMAPEVIMSQHYDAKADLWSIGTIVYQCLTGKAPFRASTPQELRLFYESNRTLLPSVPKETSHDLKDLLLGLLQRNHQERISFEEFFHHPFLETSSTTKKSPTLSYPSSASASSSCSSSTSHLASPQHSDGELNQIQLKEEADMVCDNGRDTPSDLEEYVMVPAQFPSEYTCEGVAASPIESCVIYSGCSLLAERGSESRGKIPPPSSKPARPVGFTSCQTVPVPVPTQIQNYQRLKQNLQPVGCTRGPVCCAKSSNAATKCARPQQLSPAVATTPKTPEQALPLGTRTGLLGPSPDMQDASSIKVYPDRSSSAVDLQSLAANQSNLGTISANKKGPFKRSLSTSRLSDMVLKGAFGAQLLENRSDGSFNCEKSLDAPSVGPHRNLQHFDSPPRAFFKMGSPSRGTSPQRFLLSNSSWLLSSPLSQRLGDSESMAATPNSGLFFHPPELPVDTLMEQAHTDTLTDLHFTLAFAHCVMELASSKEPKLGAASPADVSSLEQSLVTDQISQLSKEWSYAEQLVLYMKAEEFLSAALHTAKENINKGQLLPSNIVKQVIRKLNESYKTCVTQCHSLNRRLQTFLLDKQKLIDRFSGLTAEKLLYNHTVHMVQSAALDEMFHCGSASLQRYHKALLLMEGLYRIVTEQKDIDSIDKCKQCIERRLSALQS
ncbi:serine/threonine-protein kinase ULK1a isoform X2 [Takifugu flavidus]|uniref:serine/threonine-protein kinase ULK1a isoform X2 n=1 Tax=Takifugu flavidus TaxID=433684 RepID=UPI002544B3D5|nr:serine/threonine-protein kinase ULK1a isoform X2 [Takifugu flavidus]